MHEVGIISSLVKTIEKIIQKEGMTEVERVVLEVGELSGVVPDYMEKCWPAATYRTFMEKTKLEMQVVPGIVKCRDCGELFNAVACDLKCPRCQSKDMEILSGNDLIVQELICR